MPTLSLDGMAELYDYTVDQLHSLRMKHRTSSSEDEQILVLHRLVNRAAGVAFGKLFVDVLDAAEDFSVHEVAKEWNNGCDDDILDAGFDTRAGRTCEVFQGPIDRLEELMADLRRIPAKVFVEIERS